MILTSLGATAACGQDGTDRQTAAAPAQPSPPVPTTESATPPPATLPGEHAGLVPPGAAVAPAQALEPGEIALAYNSREAPARLAAWYRTNARRGAFTLASEMNEGSEHVLSGETKSPRGDFTVRLAPGERGGTAAIVLITGR
jgi:hypothetical protein